MYWLPLLHHRVRPLLLLSCWSARDRRGLTGRLYRMKALVFTLVRNFEFELAVPKEEIRPLGLFLQRPCVESERKKGAQLPLLVRPYGRS